MVDLPRSCDKNWGIRRLSSLRYRFLPCCTGIASIPTKCTSCTARGLHTYNGTTYQRTEHTEKLAVGKWSWFSVVHPAAAYYWDEPPFAKHFNHWHGRRRKEPPSGTFPNAREYLSHHATETFSCFLQQVQACEETKAHHKRQTTCHAPARQRS